MSEPHIFFADVNERQGSFLRRTFVFGGLTALGVGALGARLAQASGEGAKLRFIGRFDAGGARVGLQALPATHPLCAGGGTDNLVAIASCRYRQQPLVIRGPGAGAEVTAAALLDDVLRIVHAAGEESVGRPINR